MKAPLIILTFVFASMAVWAQQADVPQLTTHSKNTVANGSKTQDDTATPTLDVAEPNKVLITETTSVPSRQVPELKEKSSATPIED